MRRHCSPLFALALITASTASSARAQADGPNECTTWSCWWFGLYCEVNTKAEGTPCGRDGEDECDGSGKCVAKGPCNNGTWDYDQGEECDPSSAEWSSAAGACDSSCRLTRDVYGACPRGGEACWSGGWGWFCSALGACTRLCNSSEDCGAGGECVADPIDASQKLCALPGCGPGTTRQWVGRQGCFEGTTDAVCEGAPVPDHSLCGWLSVDPSTRKLWCPGEVDACCPPEDFGGSTSSSACIAH